MERRFLATASIVAFLAVAAGAFGAHALKKVLNPEMLTVYETAVRYQMYHALALGIAAISLRYKPGKWGTASGWFFISGIVLFSGSLYVLSLSGIKWTGAITPVGGMLFLAGWFCLTMHALEKKE